MPDKMRLTHFYRWPRHWHRSFVFSRRKLEWMTRSADFHPWISYWTACALMWATTSWEVAEKGMKNLKKEDMNVNFFAKMGKHKTYQKFRNWVSIKCNLFWWLSCNFKWSKENSSHSYFLDSNTWSKKFGLKITECPIMFLSSSKILEFSINIYEVHSVPSFCLASQTVRKHFHT